MTLIEMSVLVSVGAGGQAAEFVAVEPITAWYSYQRTREVTMKTAYLLAWLAIALPAPAQRIYNSDQDQRAQDALKAGQNLSTSSGFDAALDNLKEIWKLQQEQVFRSAHTQMRAEMGSWFTWGDLRKSVKRISKDLEPVKLDPLKAEAELARAKSQRDSANQQLAELAKAASSSEAAKIAGVGTWLDRVSQVGPVADYVLGMEKDTSASKAQIDAAGKAKDALGKLATLYKDFTLDLPKNPHALLLEYQFQILSLEVEHVEEAIRIQRRLDNEFKFTAEVLSPVQTALDALNLKDSERIPERLDKAAAAKNEPEVRELVSLLYNAAALAARRNTAVRLAVLRDTMEERAHSLRLAGGAAAFQQEVIVNGLQRLALYYRGGVKAASVADLLQALATVGLAPAVWTK